MPINLRCRVDPDAIGFPISGSFISISCDVDSTTSLDSIMETFNHFLHDQIHNRHNREPTGRIIGLSFNDHTWMAGDGLTVGDTAANEFIILNTMTEPISQYGKKRHHIYK